MRSIHEVEELKRAQEMQIDEFSRQELRESQATFHELTSQTQELQDRVTLTSDSREFQDVESSQWKIIHVPSQPAVVPSPRGMLSRDQSLRPDTWNLLGTSGNVLTIHVHQSTHHQHFMECFILGILMLQMETRCGQARGDLQLEVKNKNRDTIPTPRFARRPSIRNSLFPAEGGYLQN